MIDDSNEPSKFRESVERLRRRAEDCVDDIGFVDDLAIRAVERARRHSRLRDDMAPLLRLIRSYARGSYRVCPAGDAAWALAGVMYVATPVDAIPDYFPAGLHDDEAVIRWITARISATLSRYEAWELTVGEHATSSQADIAAGEDGISLEVQVLDPVDPTLFARVDHERRTIVAPIAANPLVTGAVETLQALDQGRVVRVLGPSHLLAGIDRKTLEVMHSTGGNLGVVRGSAGKQIEGHLRFGDLETTSAAAPALAGFQLASAVTLQYYLARIDRQLVSIRHEILGARQDTRDERYGRIETARARCVTSERVLGETGTLGDHDRQRLDHAAHDLEQTYNALASSLEAFCDRVETLDLQTCDKDDLGSLLKDAKGTPLLDCQLLLFAAVVRHRIHGLDVFLASGDGEARARIATDELTRDQRAMTALLARAHRAFSKLHVPKRDLDERWGLLGGPEKELVTFADATRPLRHRLADRAALPPYLPDGPFMVDMRRGTDGAVELEYASLVEPASLDQADVASV